MGFTGGILLLWNSNTIEFQPLGKGAQGVLGVIEVHNHNLSFILSAIYASSKFHYRKMLWDDLKNMASSVHVSWLL